MSELPEWRGENLDQDGSPPPPRKPTLLVAVGVAVFCLFCGWWGLSVPLALLVGSVVWAPDVEAKVMLLAQSLFYALVVAIAEASVFWGLKRLGAFAGTVRSVLLPMLVVWAPFFTLGFCFGRNGRGVGSRANQALIINAAALAASIAILMWISQTPHSGDAGLAYVFILPLVLSVVPFPLLGWLLGISGLFGSKRGVCDAG